MAISKKLRFQILARDGRKCQYCGQWAPEVVLEVDHVVPKSRGGTDDPKNLVTACVDCNRGKAALDGVVHPRALDLRYTVEESMETCSCEGQFVYVDPHVTSLYGEVCV